VLIIINGEEKGRRKDYKDLDAIVKAEDIKSVNVLKGSSATEKYGEKGKAGVIEIETKQP
jgi:bla regulator protein blaR1